MGQALLRSGETLFAHRQQFEAPPRRSYSHNISYLFCQFAWLAARRRRRLRRLAKEQHGRTLGRWVWPPFHRQNWYSGIYGLWKESLGVFNCSNCIVWAMCITVNTERHVNASCGLFPAKEILPITQNSIQYIECYTRSSAMKSQPSEQSPYQKIRYSFAEKRRRYMAVFKLLFGF